MVKKTRILTQIPKGFKDILPEEQKYFEYIKETARKHLQFSGFRHIDLPILEYKSLFTRGVGEESEIVQKQMFVVPRKSKSEEKEDYVLRPEGTASVARAYIEHGMHTRPQPVMLYYIGPFFRYEQPQESRFREFWQIGAEILGSDKPAADVEVIRVLWDILSDLGFSDMILFINSIGCPNCRSNIEKALTEYFGLNKRRLCTDCKNRFKRNIFRILDCKNDKCIQIIKEAPPILDNLCVYCKNHLRKVLESLDDLKIKYDLDPCLVRGFDYYTRTVFEIVSSEDKNRKSSLVGGGRYDNLVKLLGGPDTPAVGFALGIDRLAEIIKQKQIDVPDYEKPEIFLAQIGESAKRKSYEILKKLQGEGIPIKASPYKDKLGAQLKTANRLKVKITLIIGQKEVNDKTVIVRDMKEGVQEIVPQTDLVNLLKTKLKQKK